MGEGHRRQPHPAHQLSQSKASHERYDAARSQGRGALDHQGRRRPPVPVRKMPRRPREKPRHDPVRARLVHGLAADLRSAGAGAAGFLGDGLLRQTRLRLLVRRHGRLRPLDQGPRQQRADRHGRRRLLRGRPIHRQAAWRAPPARLRHLVRRAARGTVRRAPSGDGGAARARRHGMDRRRLADACRAAQEAPGLHRQEQKADEQGLHPLRVRPRPPRHCRAARDRGLRGRGLRARRFGADRHLCRHVLEAAGCGSGGDHRADFDHARRARRHRFARRPS